MLGAIAIIPSAPVLVPELAGGAVEVADLRVAALAAAASLPSRWVAVGARRHHGTQAFGPECAGTFAGFGVDVRVRLSPQSVDEPAELPLCALIAGWVRGQAWPGACVQARVYGPDLAAARRGGRRLRTEVEAAPDPIGVLLVADGANTLTAAAPGGYHPSDVDLQRGVDDALAAGDAAALTDLPAQIVGRAAWAVLAGLAGSGPRSATQLYRGAPYGVGYFVGVWQP